jgi:hypothetical protein
MVHAPGNDTAALEKLAAELNARGYEARLAVPDGRPPWLAVINPAATMLEETVMAYAEWFWWRTGRRPRVNGGDAEEERLRALSDIRQRFPQWHIRRWGDGWQATPRATWSVAASTLEDLYRCLEREEDRWEGASQADPGRGEASLPGILPRPREATQ